LPDPRKNTRTPSVPAQPKRGRERSQERTQARKPRNRGRARARERDISDVRKLTPLEREIVSQVGRFRTIAIVDLAKHLSKTFTDSPSHTVRKLKELGLVRSQYLATHGIREVAKNDSKVLYHPVPVTKSPTLEVVVLTHKGASWLRADGYDESKAGKLHPGLAKAREALHDSRLYSMTQLEIEKLKTNGATNFHVTTDSTLKAALYRERANLNDGTRSAEQAHSDAAATLNVPMEDGKYVLPDVRLEYDMPDGSRSSTDLELVTDTYRKSHIAAKKAAGFTTYIAGAGGLQKGGNSVWDEDWAARSR
jgi:hypothetical protein